MISTTPALTEAGTSLLVRALAGETVTFSHFKIGNGSLSGGSDGTDLVDLVNPLVTFPIESIDRSQPGKVILTGMYDNAKFTSDFRLREFGIFAMGEAQVSISADGETASYLIDAKPEALNAVTVNGLPATVSSYNKRTGILTLTETPALGAIINVRYPDGAEKLYAYANDGEEAGVIRAFTSAVVAEETIVVDLEIASSANIVAMLSPNTMYALKSELQAHIDDMNNPHRITARHVGLGNVENVATNDQKPTYVEAEKPSALVSGEPMSTAFAKIAAAVRSLIAHINDRKTNPHGITPSLIAAAPKKHEHSAADITSGVLSLARGGTGVTNLQELRDLIGANCKYTETLESEFGMVFSKPFASGSYVGDGNKTISVNSQNRKGQIIDIGFAPSKVVLLIPQTLTTAYNNNTESNMRTLESAFLMPKFYMFAPGHNLYHSGCGDISTNAPEYLLSREHAGAAVYKNGFVVQSVTGSYTSGYPNVNDNGVTYYWWAWK